MNFKTVEEDINKAKSYKDNYHFREAIEIIENIPSHLLAPKIKRLLAQCIYQDTTCSHRERYSKSFECLESISNDDDFYETLRLKGAIYKRKYLFYKDIDDLYRAIECYEEVATNDINN